MWSGLVEVMVGRTYVKGKILIKITRRCKP